MTCKCETISFVYYSTARRINSLTTHTLTQWRDTIVLSIIIEVEINCGIFTKLYVNGPKIKKYTIQKGYIHQLALKIKVQKKSYINFTDRY